MPTGLRAVPPLAIRTHMWFAWNARAFSTRSSSRAARLLWFVWIMRLNLMFVLCAHFAADESQFDAMTTFGVCWPRAVGDDGDGCDTRHSFERSERKKEREKNNRLLKSLFASRIHIIANCTSGTCTRITHTNTHTYAACCCGEKYAAFARLLFVFIFISIKNHNSFALARIAFVS